MINAGRLLPFVPIVERTLRRLSDDTWKITLYQSEGGIYKVKPAGPCPGKVLLFSGGLDLLLRRSSFRVWRELSSSESLHQDRQTVAAQATLYQSLLDSGSNLTHSAFFVSARNVGSFEHAAENSQRTRSFLFLTLAAITAYRLGRREIVLLAENGQLAIHLPLSSARMAAFSTHRLIQT